MTVTPTPGEDEGSHHEEALPGEPGAELTPAGANASWRSQASDDDIDQAFAAIVSSITTDAAWTPPIDSGQQAGAQRHPSGGGAHADTGEERARRRELRRLERAEEIASFEAHKAEVQAERDADEAHFTPPEPPPLPRPKGRTIGALLMLLGGIILLARPGLLAVGFDLALVLAVVLILGGVTILLTGIWRRHNAGDAAGWDDGAQV